MNRSEGLRKGEKIMVDNLKHSLIKFKSKLRIRNSMAGLGGITRYSTEEYSSYLNNLKTTGLL